MRTTLHLPDALYRDVKAAAAQSGRTVTSVVEDALRAELARFRAGTTDRTPFRIDAVGTGGVLAGVDLDDSAALLDLVEGR
ncbi:CopG family transcriptional regulator [Cellulomonas sp. S1-8]|uniref:ribbon-helix-helix domain-containing protein n=1 Tax=Cellulomonas sp. S1-8 TaxID=2904790 RepID=UPI00224357BB|nr:CopG family transcriptional regulator [Cellulomonas sp. S1-8]UZN02637.1 ribbon-helix-helix domain-containing protein [Cellulomonas sp. S1-8]